MAQKASASPRWSATTKLLIGLVILGILTFFIYRFSNLVPPLLMIIVVAYLFHPVTTFLSRTLHLSWRASVNILYLLILITLIGLLALGGVGLVQQVQSLIKSVQEIVTDLPIYVEQFATLVFEFGPFRFDMSTLELDLNTISQQLLSILQSLLGQMGNLVGRIAGGAVEIFGWTFFVLIVSYFVMVESSGIRNDLFKVDIPGYEEDMKRLGSELSRIWNAFLRGQIIVFSLAFVVYTILFSILGVKYAIGLALMAGLAKFLPYIGPFFTTIVMALITFFQPDKPFDLPAIWYMLGVMGVSSITDQVIDNLIIPRIMARTLKVHPAAVLVTAIVAANLLGILGVVIAAPFLATALLLGRYTMRKLFDLDPWPKTEPEPPPPSIRDIIQNFLLFWRDRFNKNKKNTKPNNQGEEE